MILDKIENIALYKKLGDRISKAIDYITARNFMDISPGKYEIEGDDIFALVNEYSTKNPEICQLEAHRKYIDIQYMIQGKEIIGYDVLLGQEISTEYNAASDIGFFKGSGMRLQLDKGMFAIFFPTDLHAPGIMCEKPSQVKKIVVKVAI